ncbi:MFS transporter [Geminicoccus roseus]|uniref:MFS transporter n=1 Tax=Geminicoccus roseus TaxID=404900 RepID=UPI0005591B2B|nr:MFS transporter [Geminicoccus roseus]
MPAGQTVQAYLDETPLWRDGTAAGIAPLTGMQQRIWWLAAAGKFFEGLVVFMTGVAMPLIAVEFQMNDVQHGLVGAASLFGILVGALALGHLADRFGRKRMFIVEMLIFVLFLALLPLSPSFTWLVLCLFGLGVALGCDYPTAHMVISESIPSAARGRLVLGAFGFQALGALSGTALGYLVLSNLPEVEAWRWMYAAVLPPAVLVAAGRFFVTRSPHWLMSHGRVDEAEAEMAKLLRRTPPYPGTIRLLPGPQANGNGNGGRPGIKALFQGGNRRATILASLPWFLQDLGTYGIGIFTPTILATALGHAATRAHDLSDVIARDLFAVEGAALIDLLLIVGIAAAVLLADRVGRIPLQVAGFLGCALGLLLAALSLDQSGPTQTILLFAGFMLFNFMTNLGPNAQTYLIAGEVFPTAIRGRGAGFAAAFGKIGAVATAFLFPILLADLGTRPLLLILVGTSLLGALVTWAFRIETAGRSLEEEPG